MRNALNRARKAKEKVYEMRKGVELAVNKCCLVGKMNVFWTLF
jgi:hypothetical protein